MGFISFVAGAASAAALFNYTRSVRSIASPTLLKAISGRARKVDAQCIDVPLAPIAAARFTNLLTRSSTASPRDDHGSIQRFLARSFFGSRAFVAERAVLYLFWLEDTTQDKLERLPWVVGDKFALWTVASCEKPDVLVLDWDLKIGRARVFGTQELRAEIVTGNTLRFTLVSSIGTPESDNLESPPAKVGPSEHLQRAGFHAALFLHELYARILTRSTAEALRRML